MPISVLSFNAGAGYHLLEYAKLGAHINLACEYRDEFFTVLKGKFKHVLQIDPVWYINRKQNGTATLLQDAGLRNAGELDVLEVLAGFDGTENNLFDGFKIARTIKPKMVLAWGPSELLSDENYYRFNRSLDYLRYDNLKDRTLREYQVTALQLNASHFGAAVDKSLTLVLGLRSDICRRKNISNELALRSIVPRPGKSKSFGSAIRRVNLTPEKKDFLLEEMMGTKGLMDLARLLPKDRIHVSSYSRTEKAGPREAKERGLSKKLINDVLRASNNAPLPDPSRYTILHPTENRLLGIEEICACWGIKVSKPKNLTEKRFKHLVCETVPPVMAKSIFKSMSSDLLISKKKFGDWDPRILKTELVENLRGEGKIRTYHCETDIGLSASKEVIGRLPEDNDYDYIFDSEVIQEDFLVLGPFNPLEGRRDVIGAIRKDAFKGKNRDKAIETIRSVRGTTDNRRNEAPTEVSQATISKWEEQGWEVRLSDDRKSYVKRKPGGKWGTFWKTEKISSANLGWVRDKQTGLPAKSAELNKGTLEEDFRAINSIATSAYRHLSFEDFVKQARFVRKRINKANTLSAVFTTMAVNRYGAEMRGMGYHIDQGDDDSGLTTISVFDEGCYEGGFFVLPRYRVAFRVGDGDVLVANSRQVHGVSALEGRGRRLSVVSYTKTSLAAKENLNRAFPAKSPRPKFRVDKYQIAIPSYKRHKTLLNKTLNVLEHYEIDPKRVTIFVADQEEHEEYKRALRKSQYQNLVVALPGIMEVRNFMWEYYPEGTPVLFMDDDIQQVQRLVKAKGEKARLEEVTDLYRDVVVPGFSTCREYNSYIWGIYAATNAMFMDASNQEEIEREDVNPDEITIGNQYIIASFYGAIIRHRKNLLVGCADKEDHERSVLHFIEDGRTVRLKYLTVKTNYYNEPGGLQETRTVDTISDGARYMKERYPNYVRVEVKERVRDGKKAEIYEVKHL